MKHLLFFFIVCSMGQAGTLSSIEMYGVSPEVLSKATFCDQNRGTIVELRSSRCGPASVANSMTLGSDFFKQIIKEVLPADSSQVGGELEAYAKKHGLDQKGMNSKEIVNFINALIIEYNKTKLSAEVSRVGILRKGFVSGTPLDQREDYDGNNAFLRRLHTILKHSLAKDFPPIILISKYQGVEAKDKKAQNFKSVSAHFVSVVRVQNELKAATKEKLPHTGDKSFVAEIVNPNGGTLNFVTFHESPYREFVPNDLKPEQLTEAYPGIKSPQIFIHQPDLGAESVKGVTDRDRELIFTIDDVIGVLP